MSSENKGTQDSRFLDRLRTEKFTVKQESEEINEPSSPEKVSKGRRLFSYYQKEECWNRATLMIGRHPDRWRLDAVGNPVFKFMKGCSGPLCHEYDHIVPFSKGGKTVPENCQILQSGVNLYKSNKLDVTHEDLIKASPKTKFASRTSKNKSIYVLLEEQMDAIELAAYGDIRQTSLDDMVSHRKNFYYGNEATNIPEQKPRQRTSKEKISKDVE